MKLKVKVDAGSGAAYIAAIDPSTGEHRKSTTLNPGQEIELGLPGVNDESGIEFADVVDSNAEAAEEPAAEGGEQGGGGEEPDAPEPEAPAAEEPQQQDDGSPAGLAIGRIVIYRSKTGKYDLPAIVNCTTATLDPEGVKLGHVPELSTPDAVHLTVFTCGKEGTSREGQVVNNEAAGGSYQEFNIPMSGFSPATATEGDEPQPGTWRFPERV